MKELFTAFIILITSSNLLSQVWTQSLNGRNVWSLAKTPNVNLPAVYAGGLTGSNSRIWKSTDNGNTWDTIYIGAGQTMWDFGFDSPENIYVANFSTGLLKSTNSGANFTVIPLSMFNNKNLQGVECGSDGYVFVSSSSGFFRSTDSGQTFNETALTGLNCLPVIVDKDSSNIVYVGVSSATGTGIGIYRSTDNGLTFSNNLNPGKNGYNLHQKDNGTIFMITTTPPYNFDISTDHGLTWTTHGNMPQAQRGVTSGGFNYIYTSGNGGVFRSSNNGQTFENHNFTFTTTPILYSNYLNTLTVFTGATGSVNGGVWKFIEGIVQSTGNSNELINDYSLSQNFPNPFNPVTTIGFTIPLSQNVILKVYNGLGVELETLVNDFITAGSHSIKFDASKYPSGVYYYKINTGNFSSVRKMLLIK